MRAAAAILLVAAACGSQSELEVTVMPPQACDDFCVDELVVAVDGVEAAPVPCGGLVPITMLDDGAAHTVEIRTVGRGHELRGTTTVEPVAGDFVDVAIDLEPMTKPVIGESHPIGFLGVGARTTLRGERFFGGQGRSIVTVDGSAAPADDWTDGEVVAQLDDIGDVVVTSCGVASEPFPFEVGYTFETVDVAFPGCATPRLVAADVRPGADEIATLFECPPCEGMVYARLTGDGSVSTAYTKDEGVCPLDFALTGSSLDVLIGRENGDRRLYTLEDIGTATLARVFRDSSNFKQVASQSPDVVGLVGVRDRPHIWTDFDADQIRSFETVTTSVADIAGPYAIATPVDGFPSLLATERELVVETWPIQCRSPRKLALLTPDWGPSPLVAVACDRAVELFDTTTGFVGAIDTPPGTAGIAVGAGMTRGGALVVMATSSGDVVFADPVAGWSTKQRIDDISPDGAFVRAYGSDRFLFSGATDGAVRILELR